ncbi:MAG: tryptophan--tRNA ligase, partial [Thermaurantiacus sp.]
GEDQKQHLELARDIAGKFNTDFGREVFPLPEPTIPPAAPRVRSLRDGTAKMSKSDPSDMSRINLADDADLIVQKIRKARTDPEPLPATLAELEGRPEARNLLEIYAAMSGETADVVLDRFSGQGFGIFKPALADLLVATLEPMNRRFRELLSDAAEIDRVLAEGADRAKAVAEATMQDVRAAVGFLV